MLSHPQGVPEGLEEAAHEHSPSPAHSQPTSPAGGLGKGLLVPRATAFILGTPSMGKEEKWVYWALGVCGLFSIRPCRSDGVLEQQN